MSLFNSPSVVATENDATAYTQEISNNVGALVGAFVWGPVDQNTLITQGESELVQRFGAPTNDTYLSFFVAADFLSYSNVIWINRQVGAAAKNAVSGANTPILVKNSDAALDLNLTGYDFYAKYAGANGNALLVSIADTAKFATWEFANNFQYKPLANEYAIAVVDTKGIWSGSGQTHQKETLAVTGSATADGSITVFGQTVPVLTGDTASVVAGKIATVLAADTTDFSSATAYNNIVTYVAKAAGKKVARTAPVTGNGLTFAVTVLEYGRLGSLLEKYELVSQDKTAKNADGTSAYYATQIQGSNFIAVGDTTVALSARDVQLAGGADDNLNVDIHNGVSDFSNKEQFNLAYFIGGAVSSAEQQAVIDLADTRQDCMAFVSPMFDDVYNNKGNEITSILEWRENEVNKESSYAFNDCQWALIYDKYNDVNRWIPTCGGTAGIFARSAAQYDPWVSPAGHTRGIYKNYIRLAWNPDEGARDALYRVGVNAIVSFPGEGTILYGDKTSLSRPSAFDRVNVRWAFIVARTSLSSMAKYFLFELNNAFTQNQFVNAARPFLRSMVARNAFQDFKVVCDGTNNNAQVQVSNQMVAQVLLKPVYSINWVALNLTAVRPDVTFEEVQMPSA